MRCYGDHTDSRSPTCSIASTYLPAAKNNSQMCDFITGNKHRRPACHLFATNYLICFQYKHIILDEVRTASAQNKQARTITTCTLLCMQRVYSTNAYTPIPCMHAYIYPINQCQYHRYTYNSLFGRVEHFHTTVS